MSKLEKFIIGAIGGLAPSVVMMAAGKIDLGNITVSELLGVILINLALASLTGFVVNLYEEENRLKLFWVGVTLPSMILNVTAEGKTTPARKSQILFVPAVYAQSQSTEIRGRLSGLTGACPNVGFTVNGTSVQTSQSTDFDNIRCPHLRDGLEVEVEGMPTSNGTLQASEVELRSGSPSFINKFLNGVRRALGRTPEQ
jgi:Domain of unknown function (DUF5666)